MPDALLTVRNLKKYFPIRKGVLSRVANYVKAVDDVNFDIGAGERMSLIAQIDSQYVNAVNSIVSFAKCMPGKINKAKSPPCA